MTVEEAYKNIEKIITYGFLYKKFSVFGCNFIFKNVMEKEFEDLFALSSKEKDLNLICLAYSTIFFNGISFLKDRINNLPSLIDFYRSLPTIFVNKVINVINDVNELYLDSIEYLEGFCYSERSRFLWSVLDPYNRSSYVGLEGVDDLGMNNVIENWIHINKKLDEEEEYNKELNMILLIVGSSNYKAARTLSRNYEMHQRELKELRMEICKYGHSRNRAQENDKKREEWTAPLLSREDMVKELYRQASGYKDKHDIFIEEWLKKQKEKAERAKKEVEEKQKSYRKKIENENENMNYEISRPATKEELERINKKVKKIGSRII